MPATCQEKKCCKLCNLWVHKKSLSGCPFRPDGKMEKLLSEMNPANASRVRWFSDSTLAKGSVKEAIQMQCEMLDVADLDNFVCGLQECRRSKNSEYARHIYEHACSYGLDSQSLIGNYVVQMLAECGCICVAEQVLQRLDYQNEHSWTALLLGSIDNGQVHRVFDLYNRMKQHGVSPSVYTFMALLKACARLKNVGRGREVHAEIMQNPRERDLYVDNALIDMYIKCGSLSKAREVFDQLVVRDVVSWTALITGYTEHGSGQEALECFQKMKADGVPPNDCTLVCVLKACGTIGAVAKGREIGKEVMEKQLQGNTFLGNSLVDMYAKCGALLEAREVFDKLVVRNVVSWNVLIAGYAEHGPISQALKCFEQMQAEGVSPDGMSWTSLIAGFAEHGPGQEALKLFERMRRKGILPDAVAFASVLKACSNVGAIDKGRELHMEIIKKDYDDDLFIGNNLIEMYARSGTLLEADKVFNKLVNRDICVWNSMIKACAVNQEGRMAVHCFEDMQKQGIKPDIVTFTCLLAACGHARMVDKGEGYLTLMRDHYGLIPTIDHYTSVVDLLSRSGHVYEAENFLLKVVPRPLYDEGMWAALLTACKTFGEVEVGERCFKQLIEMNPEVAPPYVLMADIYSSAGRWDDAHKIEELRKWSRVEKKPATDNIEPNDEACEFQGGDTPSKKISRLHGSLILRLEMQGHIPNIGQIVALTPEEKETLPNENAENMAVAFGITNTESAQTMHATTYVNMYNDSITANKHFPQMGRLDGTLNDFSFVYS